MLTIILVSVGTPILAGIGYLIMRDGHPQWTADMRGIALQTVIVIVVLLAIAGAVAGVLITRGEAEVATLQEQSTTGPARFSVETSCKAGGFEWDAAGCYDKLANKAACKAKGGTWTDTGKRCVY